MNVADIKVLIDTLEGIGETEAELWYNDGRDGQDSWVPMKLVARKLKDKVILQVKRK